MYFFFGVASFFSAYFISFFTYKVYFIIASLGINLFVLLALWLSFCEKYPNGVQCSKNMAFALVIPTTSLAGICVSLVWVIYLLFLFFCFLFIFIINNNSNDKK